MKATGSQDPSVRPRQEVRVPVLPPVEAFHAGDGRIGVLLVHGFTSTPASMTPWAQHLAEAGYRVSVPLLPGHGTTWQDMNRSRWTDWYAAASDALDDLLAQTDQVFVTGLSMGGGLALRLAEQRPSDIAGLLLVNPSVLDPDKRLLATPVLKHIIGSVPGIASDIKKPGVVEDAYDRVPLKALDSLRQLWTLTRSELSRVTAPILLFRSEVDHVVPSSSSACVIEHVSSADVTEQVLTDSFHVAVLDNDAPGVFKESVAFIERLTLIQPTEPAPESSGQDASGEQRDGTG